MFFLKHDNQFLPLDTILMVEQRGAFSTSKAGKTVCRANLILIS
jgi:hypothetical protein